MSIGTSREMGVTDPRRATFVSITVAFVLFVYLFSPFSSLFLGWFVEFDDPIDHHVHEVTFGMLFAMMLLGVAAQLRKPEANVAGLQQAILVAVVLSVVVATSTGVEWTALFYVVPTLAIAHLHPARHEVFSIPRFSEGGLLYLALPATLPFIFGFVEEFEKAINEVRGHQAHWGGMATFALVVVMLALLAASRPRGWRLVAWTTGSSMIVYGVASMSFPFDASARPGLAAVVAIVWGVLFLTTTERIVRRERRPVEAEDIAFDGRADAGQRLVLRRVVDGRLFGGVAGGIARRIRVPVAAVRVLFFLPLAGAVLYLLGLWRIPVEQPGDLVEPSPQTSPHVVLRAVVLVPAVVITMLGGLMIYAVAASDAPPVPHVITSTSPASCLECHATGVEHAPVIDPFTHNTEQRRPGVAFCAGCHRLPELTQALSSDGPGPEHLVLVTVLNGTAGQWSLPAADLERVKGTLETLSANTQAP